MWACGIVGVVGERSHVSILDPLPSLFLLWMLLGKKLGVYGI